MLPTPETTSTPWRHGPFKAQLHKLSFGQTYEDSAIELHAFKPRSLVFCIAGAGCTAREPRAGRCELASPSVYSHSVAIWQSLPDGAASNWQIFSPCRTLPSKWNIGTADSTHKLGASLWIGCSLRACSAYGMPARSLNHCRVTSGRGSASAVSNARMASSKRPSARCAEPSPCQPANRSGLCATAAS